MTKTSRPKPRATPATKPAGEKKENKRTPIKPVSETPTPKTTVAAVPDNKKTMKTIPPSPTVAAVPDSKETIKVAPPSPAVDRPEIKPVEAVTADIEKPLPAPAKAVKNVETAPAKRPRPASRDLPYKAFLSFYGDGLDALVTSSSALNKGYREVSQTLLTLATSSLDDGLKAAQDLMDCADVNEATERQMSLFLGNLENAAAGGQKLADISVKTGNKVMAPFSGRIDAVIKTWGAPLT